MAAHRKSQQKSNWYDTKTREDLKGLSEDLVTRADKKIEEGCGHIIMPMAVAFRGKKPHQIESRKEKIEKIIEEAKPPTETPKMSHTTSLCLPSGLVQEITRSYDGQTVIVIKRRKHPDGTAEEDKRTYTGPEAKQMWEGWEGEEQKRRKTSEEAPGNALT